MALLGVSLGMYPIPREPERARKGPKGPDEASNCKNLFSFPCRLKHKLFGTVFCNSVKVMHLDERHRCSSKGGYSF